MENEKYVVMGAEDFQKFHRETVRIVKETISKEQSRESVRKKEAKVMKRMLESYRQRKQVLQEEFGEFTPDEKREFRLSFLEDLMGTVEIENGRTERALRAREAKRREVAFELRTIENAIEKFEKEVENSQDQLRSDWLFSVKALYINDEVLSLADLADYMMCDERTIRRYVDRACEVLVGYVI